MQPARLITFRQLRAILETRYHCTVEFFPEGAGQDRDGSDSPPLYAFHRDLGARPVRDEDVLKGPFFGIPNVSQVGVRLHQALRRVELRVHINNQDLLVVKVRESVRDVDREGGLPDTTLHVDERNDLQIEISRETNDTIKRLRSCVSGHRLVWPPLPRTNLTGAVTQRQSQLGAVTGGRLVLLLDSGIRAGRGSSNNRVALNAARHTHRVNLLPVRRACGAAEITRG